MPTNPSEYIWPGIIAAQAMYTAAKLRILTCLLPAPRPLSSWRLNAGRTHQR